MCVLVEITEWRRRHAREKMVRHMPLLQPRNDRKVTLRYWTRLWRREDTVAWPCGFSTFLFFLFFLVFDILFQQWHEMNISSFHHSLHSTEIYLFSLLSVRCWRQKSWGKLAYLAPPRATNESRVLYRNVGSKCLVSGFFSFLPVCTVERIGAHASSSTIKQTGEKWEAFCLWLEGWRAAERSQSNRSSAWALARALTFINETKG